MAGINQFLRQSSKKLANPKCLSLNNPNPWKMAQFPQCKSVYLTIWDTVRQIPKGKVATYGEIAKLTGLISQARLVGQALHNLPPLSNVPRHRVINSQGKISLPTRNGQYNRQKRLLINEGIVSIGEKIDLDRFSWLRTLLPHKL